MLRRIKHLLLHTFLKPFMPAAPADGYAPGDPAPLLDRIPDRDLEHLNRLLPWKAFTVDGKGRRLGDVAWRGKRSEPQAIPDRRIVLLDREFGLADKSVLEIGCFEGIHTIGLSRLARSVTAIDSRIDNVVKTLVRAAFYGCRPTVFTCDVERRPLPADLLRADVLHHVGVLYHLSDPAAHLADLSGLARVGLMLDTHVAAPRDATKTYESQGRTLHYRVFAESGEADPFSGMSAESKWLRLEDIVSILRESGFPSVRVAEEREERNGPRVLLFARKAAAESAP